MRSNRSSALYGTALLTAAQLLSQLLAFVYRMFLSRMIGPETMGLYQLIMPVYSVLMSICVTGLTVAVATLSSEYDARGLPGQGRAMLRRCLLLFFPLFLPAAAIVAAASDPISVYLLGDARTRLGLVLLLPCILLTGVENLHKHFFYGTGNVRPPAFAELLEQCVRTAAVLGLLALFLPQNGERTVGIIVIGMTICEAVSSCTLVLLYRRHTAHLPPCPRLPAGERGALTRRIAAIALPVAFTSLLGNLIAAANAVLIPQRLVHAGAEVSQAMSDFGILCGMTLPMLSLPTVVLGAMGLVLVPKLAESTALRRSQDARRRAGKAITACSLVMMPAMALMAVLGPTLGRLLFREESAGDFILPLAAAMLLSSYQGVLSNILNGVGRQGAAARNAILSGALQLLCTYVFMGIPGVGLAGYVAAALLSSALALVLNWRDVARALELRLLLFQWCTAPALASVLMALCVRLLFRLLPGYGLGQDSSALVCLLFGAVLYLAALQAQGVSPAALLLGKKRS